MATTIKPSLKSGGYIEYIDVLRILSMFSVVFLHTAAGSLRGNFGSPIWHVSNFLTGIMSTSVPIFFMISGAMLLSNEKTTSVKITYQKRLPKALVPFVVWSLVAVLYFGLLSFVINDAVNWKDVFGRLKNITGQPTTVHLWFMYALIPLYLLAPLLKRLIDSLDESLARYMMLLWLIFSSVLPTIASFVPSGYQSLLTFNPSFNLNFMGGFLGYFILGYYLFKYDRPVSKKLLLTVIIFDSALIALGTWWKTSEKGQYNELFKSYSKLFVLILSVAIFLYVKECLAAKSLSARMSGLVKWLSSASFGVYLVHNLLVDLISRRVNLWPAKSFLILFGIYFVVVIVSLAGILIASSIKYTSFLFTGLSYQQACDSFNLKFLFKRKKPEPEPEYFIPDTKAN